MNFKSMKMEGMFGARVRDCQVQIQSTHGDDDVVFLKIINITEINVFNEQINDLLHLNAVTIVL
ncbi:uncharacterized protein G2W53_028417 [Senna tora]|uniref:Uncharacterized protein n=1 Tax=Senna tora TaxID=362788 RepID=A0A834T0W5_9FABA|nr:uncharacterized protein G2W53_028417 [Senna tora]